jgi:hypothetical protein
VRVLGIAGQFVPDQDGRGILGEDRDPVPGPLPAPDRAIAGIPEGRFRKARVGRLELLQADDVRLRRAQPFEQVARRRLMSLMLKVAIFIARA